MQLSHNLISHSEPLQSLPAPFSMLYTSTTNSQYISAVTASFTPRSGSKRSVFLPTSASFSQLPNKYPLPMSLQITEY